MERNIEKININYEYFLHYVKSQKEHRSIKVLDYGCGKGDILQLLIDDGINARGVDVYHQGPSGEVLSSELYKQGKIKIIEVNKPLPFEDESFDLIISNQVFEHVSDMNFVISELSRVLKDDGKMYHHFPSKEVWREGHIGILFSHWFSDACKLRYPYVYFMRLIGLGRNKRDKTIKEWIEHNLGYLDEYCFYRKEKELKKIFENFNVKNKEMEYIKFRGQSIYPINRIIKIKIFNSFYELIFKKLAFKCIELRKK